MNKVDISLPKTDKTVAVDIAALPANVTARLIELGLTAYMRSAVNSAFSTELTKAETAHNEANEGKKNAKPFDKDAFKPTTDPVAVAVERVEALLKGEIRAARGKSAENKVLSRLVKANIVARLMAKGKKTKEANELVGDDPFAFIDKTARKRAGDDDAAYKVELDRLYAQYVTPAKAMLGDDEAPEAAEGEAEGEGSDALV